MWLVELQSLVGRVFLSLSLEADVKRSYVADTRDVGSSGKIGTKSFAASKVLV